MSRWVSAKGQVNVNKKAKHAPNMTSSTENPKPKMKKLYLV